MTRQRPVDLVREGGQACVYALELWWWNSTSSRLLCYLHVCLSIGCAYICISMHPSTHFKQLIAQKYWNTRREDQGTSCIAWWELQVMMSHGILALPMVWTNQRAFSCHLTAEQKGRETSNSQWGDKIVERCMPHHGAYELFYSTLQYSPPDALYLPPRTHIR